MGNFPFQFLSLTKITSKLVSKNTNLLLWVLFLLLWQHFGFFLFLANPLSYLFNLAFQFGMFPICLKTAKVIPTVFLKVGIKVI